MKKCLLCGLLIGLACFLPLRGEAKIYRWVDANGVSHFTDNEQKIPEDYRKKVKVSVSQREAQRTAGRTVVNFERKGNAVLVNAVLNYHVPVVFFLDTGATNTLITEEDAVKLGIDTRKASRVRTQIADGSEVEFPKIRLTSLKIGNAEVRNLDVLVGKMRLLGLTFLNHFKLTMNSEQGQFVLEAPTDTRERESAEVSREKEHAVAKYEVKQEKLRLDMERVQKNIELLESKIDSLQKQRLEFEEKITRARRNSSLRIDEHEVAATIERMQLAIDSHRLQVESYKKDIEILEKNIEYYQDWIYKLK